jgi:hypothetical protein
MVDITIGEDTVSVPDLKLFTGWHASLTDHGIPVIHLTRNGRRATVLLFDFGLLGGNQTYVVCAPRRILQHLRDRLGTANVTPLIRALRNRLAVRRRAKALGFSPVRNSSGDIVNVRAPLVICGRATVDHDGDEIEAMPTLPGMEP